jgi:type I restriction enzyme S subunit
MDVMAGYKQTEVGVIPEDWEVKSIESIGSVIRGASPRPKGDKRFYGGNVPRLMVEDVTRDKKWVTPSIDFLTEEGAKHSRPCKRGTLTIVCSGTPTVVGLPSLLAVDACIHDGMLALVHLDKEVAPDYLFHQIRSLQERLQAAATHGGTFVNLTTTGLRAFKVVLPPTKTEQEVIAKALSDADSLIESIEQLIAKKRHLKQGAMQELLRPKDGWVTTNFGAVTDRVVGGGTPSRTVASYWNGDIPWMTVKDFANHSPKGTLEYITRDGLKNSASNLIPRNTIIISTRMALGKAVIFNVDVAINQDLKAIFPCKDIETRFMYYWFQFNEPRIAEMGSGSTVMGISLVDLRKIPFVKPPQAEQITIAAILSDMDAEIAALESKLIKALQLKQGMMHNLLTGKIRLAPQASTIIPFPKAKESKVESAKRHNWQFKEAVLISVLVKHFGSEQYPLGRKRYTKLSYLFHRYVERRADGYLKKAAGPYNPDTRYKGPEKIAQENGYIRFHKRGQFTGFIAGETISKAECYFPKSYGNEVLTWLEQFRFKTNDELELLATVDMAMEDLRRAGQTVDVEAVKRIIQEHPEWEAKLQRDIFSAANITLALQVCQEMFV